MLWFVIIMTTAHVTNINLLVCHSLIGIFSYASRGVSKKPETWKLVKPNEGRPKKTKFSESIIQIGLFSYEVITEPKKLVEPKTTQIYYHIFYFILFLNLTLSLRYSLSHQCAAFSFLPSLFPLTTVYSLLSKKP